MPKTSKITFNVNDLQREHTGQKRCYDNVGLARLINSTGLLQRTNIARIRKETMYLTDFIPPTSAFTY